ncbi:hypothetical protein FRC02_004578 [Tulasnella sp. 418]|nr:hypothetical protein FRC02_004578 [Tulasnella sp. 418]
MAEPQPSPSTGNSPLEIVQSQRMYVAVLRQVSATGTLLFGASAAFLAAAITLDPENTPHPHLLFTSCLLLLTSTISAIVVSITSHIYSVFLETTLDLVAILPMHTKLVVQPHRYSHTRTFVIYLYLLILILVIGLLGAGGVMLLMSRKGHMPSTSA